MLTIIRKSPTGPRVFTECTPQEVAAERLNREIARMVATGYHKSSLGSPRMNEFIPDTGNKKMPHKTH